jgi:hypothetical protein
VKFPNLTSHPTYAFSIEVEGISRVASTSILFDKNELILFDKNELILFDKNELILFDKNELSGWTQSVVLPRPDLPPDLCLQLQYYKTA